MPWTPTMHAANREQPFNGRLVDHAARELTQVPLRDEVLDLSRGDAEPLGGLGHGKEIHDMTDSFAYTK
jgi:hypothetical protein